MNYRSNMKMSWNSIATRCITSLTFLLLTYSISAQQPKHTFALSDSNFILDGKPFLMISGEMHCARIPRSYWRDRMKKAKAMGLNTIGTYVFWNAHEPYPGQFDFSGNNDIAAFVKTAQEEGLWVVMRPSPYVCAEWEFGGYPWWLLKNPTMKVRSKDPQFLSAYKQYLHRLAQELVPLQVTHGGNILMIQIENEYGSYSDDREYLDINRQIFREVGFDVELFTCDPAKDYARGYLPGYLPAINGLDKPQQVKDSVNKYHGKGPYYIAEWYPGWFDDWGKPHKTKSGKEAAERLDQVLAANISINMYMFHGGTTRGFMNGANFNDKKPYAPQVSSYDYDAPLDEAGNITEKFILFRNVIAKHLTGSTQLPPLPEKSPTIAVPAIRFTEFSNLMNHLPKSVSAINPLSFEELNQGYGYVLYRNIISKSSTGVLRINALRDFATLYINGRHIATLDRRLKQEEVSISVNKNDTLDILVENLGRINFGPYLIDNRKGITHSVTLNEVPLENWQMYKFPFNDLKDITFHTTNTLSESPGFYKAVFDLERIEDTYLDMHAFGKGFVFLNGHHLGRYWNIGPQQTIYVPKDWLKKQGNEIVVFDVLKSGHTSISTLEAPKLDQLNEQ